MIQGKAKRKAAVALGFFDGLHRAHMKVLENALQKRKDGFLPLVTLFDEHPLQVLNGENVPELLQESKRDEILMKLGFESCLIAFSEIKDMSPEDFFEKILLQELNAAFISCGYNYRFGKNGRGDTDMLKRLCGNRGMELCVCPEVKSEGEAVSSTAIRKAVEAGDIEKANRMLGRSFGFCTEVFSGDKRGRTLGAPTINQYLPQGFAVPLFGVYASAVKINGKYFRAVTNIGNRPTFDGSSVRSETFIMGFSGDLYGKCVDTELYGFIRKEKRFNSIEELKRQIQCDVEAAKAYSAQASFM